MDYVISCGEGRRSWFNITDMALEEPDCENPGLSGAMRYACGWAIGRGDRGGGGGGPGGLDSPLFDQAFL